MQILKSLLKSTKTYNANVKPARHVHVTSYKVFQAKLPVPLYFCIFLFIHFVLFGLILTTKGKKRKSTGSPPRTRYVTEGLRFMIWAWLVEYVCKMANGVYMTVWSGVCVGIVVLCNVPYGWLVCACSIHSYFKYISLCI